MRSAFASRQDNITYVTQAYITKRKEHYGYMRNMSRDKDDPLSGL